MTEYRTIRNGPFRGYVSAYPKHSIDAADAAPDSRDYRYHPVLGKWIERAGSVILGDTLSSGHSSGLLKLTYSSTLFARKIFEFPSVRDGTGVLQFTDGYPSYSALYSNTNTSGGIAASQGMIYFRTTNSGGSNQEPGYSWSSTTYPTTTRTAKSFIKAIPTWVQMGVEIGRMTSTYFDSGYRRYLYGGCRNVLISGNWLYTPGFQCDGRRWNMLYNDDGASPTRKERHYPIGLTPPLFPAFIQSAAFPTPTGAAKSWKVGDRFYISIQWIFEDGSVSRPFIPTAKLTSTNVPGGMNDTFGLVTLTGVVGNHYEYIPWRNIPKAPPGCIGKRLLRGTKVDAQLEQYPALTNADDNTLNLNLTAIIGPNVTSYDDYHGNDFDLLSEPDLIRADIIEPPRARNIGAFDGRAGIGYTMPSPRLIYLSVTGVTAPNDVTADDDTTLGAGTYGTNLAYAARTVGTSLQLRKIAAAYPSAPTTYTIAMSGKTVQEVVDLINSTQVSDTANEWRAQLAPGADGSQPSTAIRLTDTNADFGDDGLVNDATKGNMVCTSQAYPGVLFWDYTALLALQSQPDRLSFWFSSLPPQGLAAGMSSSPNFWIASNRRQPPDADSGIYLGMAALTNGAVLFYSKKVWLFRNIRDGRTGRDEDYRFDLLSNDGCIAWDSIVEFNNAVGWLSAKGYKVTGGNPGDEVLISGAIYDPNTNTGDLAYEIGKCIASVAADDEDQKFHAARIGHVLTIHYRSSSSASAPDYMHEYDFSEGAGSGGLAELFRPDGAPYGWGTPYRLPGGAIGYYRGAAGIIKLHAVDGPQNSTEGRIDQFDTGYQDNGTAITPVLYTKQDDLDAPGRRHRVRNLRFKYKSPTGHTMTVTQYRDRGRVSSYAYTLDNTGTAEVATQTKRCRLEMQSPSRVDEFAFSGTRVTAGAAEIYLMEKDCKLLDTPVDSAG